MIGQTIEGPGALPIGGIVFGLMGAGLVAAAIFVANLHYAIGALLPFVLSFFLWKARRPAFSAQFTENAIEICRPPLVIPYEQLLGLEIVEKKPLLSSETLQSFALQVFHSNGVLEIPSRLNVSSGEIYQFLDDRIALGGPPEVNPALADYRRRQEDAFGTERVWSYSARRQLGRAQTRRARAVLLAIFLTGLAWIIVGAAGIAAAAGNEFLGWLPVGILMAVFGGLFYVLFRLPSVTSGVRVKNWRQASLVISPVGLAMVQGEVQGELRWDEVLDVQLRSRPGGFYLTSPLTSETTAPVIVLSVEGAKIVIADIYVWPLAHIYEKIMHYWRK